MKIVISGGLGYVGGRLSRYFAELGHEVVALSRQAGQLDAITFPANMQVLHPDAIKGDGAAMQNADAFIHLAAMNENDCVKYPAKAIDVNITGTVRWLDLAKAAGIPRFIYFSTAHVYAKPLEGYFDENTLTRPVHPYAITHKCAEDYVLAYAADKDMLPTVIRLTNAFGGPAFPTADRWTLLVNDICKSAVEKGSITLLSDGLQLRDFICLNDVSKAVHHLLNLPGSKLSDVYNLGSGRSSTILEMAKRVQQVAKQFLNTEISFERKAPAEDSKLSSLDISIERLVSSGFKPENDVEQEIGSTLKYFKEQITLEQH